MKTKNDIAVLTGAGQLGMAIVRRMAYGNKIFVADWKMENAEATTKTLVGLVLVQLLASFHHKNTKN